MVSETLSKQTLHDQTPKRNIDIPRVGFVEDTPALLTSKIDYIQPLVRKRQIVKDAVEKKIKAEIIEMYSGEANTHALDQAKFDLVNSDVQMPNGTGIWLYEFMLAKFLDTPLILFTSSVEEMPKPDKVLKAVVEKFQVKDFCKIIENLIP